ncbi:MAG: polysaccharide biosynthesis tyrosine autokinase [Gammaproteobacteria bacterium]|nr:polysaccharide biosynthesis tyrosine autokinase [Gammaproteobacteria bacterium]
MDMSTQDEYDISNPVTSGKFKVKSKDNEDIDIREFWRIIMRHKGKTFFLTLLSALISAIIVLPQKSVYRSTATLLLDPETSHIAPVESVYGVKSGDQYYKTQYEILKSRSLAYAVINKMGLENSSEFKSQDQQNKFQPLIDWFQENLPVQELIADVQGIFSDPSDHYNSTPGNKQLESDNTNATEILISKFLSRLTIKPIRDSQLVNVSFDAYDPKLAAKIANTLVKTYINKDLESKHALTKEASDLLSGRLADLRAKLESSEKALQEYREKEKLVEIGDVTSLTSMQLQELNQQLMLVNQQRSREEAALQQIKSLQGVSIDRLSSTPVVLSDSVVASLKQAATNAQRKVSTLGKRYGPKHPKLIQAKADLQEAKAAVARRVESVVAGVEKEYNVTKSRENAIKNAIWQARSNMQDLNRKNFALQALVREVDSNRQLYERFVSRLKETNEASGFSKPVARISDPASPAFRPIRPKKTLIVIIASILGACLGVLLAFLLEHLDNTIKKSSDLVDRLNIPLLGLLPHIKLKKLESSFTYSEHDKTSFFSESIRTIRTAIQLSGLKTPYKIIVITSSVPGEGKSTVSSNIAMSLGDTHKVLLIDADLRRPRVSGAMELESKNKGLSELITQKIEPEDCYYQVGDNNLYVMPIGNAPENPLDLISSKVLYQTLTSLSEIFDYIIIDSPPVMAVSDALILSTYANGVIYVVKAEATPFPVVQEGLSKVRQANPRIIGGVFNDVPHKKGGKNKFDYYSDSHYGPYGYSKG